MAARLFLDEIANIPLAQQAKLLRVLEDGEFERVGSSRTLKVDVRLIAATNADLAAEVARGAFPASDLLFRLNTVEAAPAAAARTRRRHRPRSPNRSSRISRGATSATGMHFGADRARMRCSRYRVAGQRARAFARDRARGADAATATSTIVQLDSQPDDARAVRRRGARGDASR